MRVSNVSAIRVAAVSRGAVEALDALVDEAGQFAARQVDLVGEAAGIVAQAGIEQGDARLDPAAGGVEALGHLGQRAVEPGAEGVGRAGDLADAVAEASGNRRRCRLHDLVEIGGTFGDGFLKRDFALLELHVERHDIAEHVARAGLQALVERFGVASIVWRIASRLATIWAMSVSACRFSAIVLCFETRLRNAAAGLDHVAQRLAAGIELRDQIPSAPIDVSAE